MVYAAYNYTITDETGDLVTGASVEVRRESDNVLATLYSDRAGASPIANPFTDSTGTGRFHVVGGAYKVTATKGAFTRSFRFVAIGLAAEQDFVFESITASTANEGINIDATDPANPTISGVAFTGDSGSGGQKGMVPAPAAGDAAANKYLKANGLWTAVAAGGGKVRIVDFAGGIYTPASDTKAIYGILTGGGAGGGSAAHAAAAVGYTSAAGGTGGNTIIFSIDEADLFSSGTAKQFEVIIGVGGAGAPLPTTSASVSGTNGGDSTFTNYTGSTVNMRLLAKGGVGGSRGITNVRAAPPDAAASTITVNSGFTSLKTVGLVGGSGNVSLGINVNTAVNFGATISAEGGASYWGPGAIPDASQAVATGAVSVNGKAAIFPGAGGGGGAIRKNGTSASVFAASGGAGATGKCLILEFY